MTDEQDIYEVVVNATVIVRVRAASEEDAKSSAYNDVQEGIFDIGWAHGYTGYVAYEIKAGPAWRATD